MSPAGGLLERAELSEASGVSAGTIEHQREGLLGSGFRAGGHDERLGFTVVETRRDKEALGPRVRQEVRVLLDRLAGEVEPDRPAGLRRQRRRA